MKPRLSVFAFWIAFIGMLSLYANEGVDSKPETLSLQEAVRLALARSPEILLAEAQSLRASNALREARALRLPQVVAGTGLAYNNGFPLSIEGSAPSIFEVGASQSIFSKTNNNLIREAEETGKAGKLGKESARNEIAERIALVYYGLHQSRKNIALISANLESARKQQAQIESLFAAGKAIHLDVTMAGIAIQSLQLRLQEIQENEKILEFELLEKTGLPGTASIRTIEPQIDNPIFNAQGETLYQQAIQSTPEILQAEANVRAKEFHIEAEKGESYPRIAIISNYALFSKMNNYQDYFKNFVRNNFIIGLSMQVPVFNGFRTGAKVAQSKQEAAETRFQLQNLKSGLKLNIQRELSALRIAGGKAELARNEVKAAEENLQVNQSLFESGRISAQEMENIRSTLQQKQLALLETDQALFQRKVTLLRAAGIVASALQ
jgi:outer membrane protein TolC